LVEFVSETVKNKEKPETATTYSGITIKWNKRVDKITSKANRQLNFLKRNLKISSQQIKAKHLEKLVNNIWEKEVVSSDWNKGLIVKIPKKGDRAVCDNYTCITLLSTSSKVFSKIIVQRIQRGVEKKRDNS
jgi:hypothetical protein